MGSKREMSTTIWVIIALMATVVALLGGSSRPDAVQIIALRPLAALFLIPAVYLMARERVTDVRPLLILAGLFVLWTVIQLVPLPPSVWQALPGREPVVAIGEALGMQSSWRPISLVPARTLNALTSMIVPITGLLLAAAMGARPIVLLLTIVGLGVANTAMGIIQVLGIGDGIFYFYAFTSPGTPAGIFANGNHSAVFGAICLLITGYLALAERSRFRARGQRLGLAAASLFLLVGSLIGGSRAGLIATFLALFAIGFIFWSVREPLRTAKGKLGWAGRLVSSKPAVLGIAGALIIGLIAIFWQSQRVPALDRMDGVTSFEDFRFLLWQPLGQMVADFWVLGSGLGAFEKTYLIYEPTELLFSFYVNQAHNDWVQLLIEGGAPAILLLLASLYWMVRRAKWIVKDDPQATAKLIFWAAILVIVSFASLLDYPLRTPIFQLVAVWLLVAFSRHTKAVSKDTVAVRI